MTRAYAERRRLNAALIHRYRVRGMAVARIVRKCLGSGHVRLVDVGSADGLALIETARQLGNGEFVGVEYSRELLAMAPRDMPANVTLLQGDAMRLPDEISDTSFDVATAMALLEHLPDPVCALKKLWRVLRPGRFDDRHFAESVLGLRKFGCARRARRTPCGADHTETTHVARRPGGL